MTEPDVEARRYHRWQLVLSIAEFVVAVAVLVGWLASGLAAGLGAGLSARVGWRPAVIAAMLAVVGGSSAVATFPLDVVSGFVLPRRAGLLAQPLGAWLADKAKGLAIGGVLALLAFELLYAFLGWSATWWWLPTAATLALASVLLAAVVPIWIVPLFYRLTPLEDQDLRARLLGLAGRVGVDAADVTVADFSRKGRTANAAVVGLGRTRRILVSDTLLARFPPEEIEVVLAHELAHHARGHLARGLAVQAALLVGILALTHLALGRFAAAIGLASLADPAGLPLLALGLTAGGLVATPLAAGWSRRLEREADAIALDVTGAPAAFVAAMERLAGLNLAERRPPRLKQLLFATHPSIEQRIAFATARAAGAAA